MDTPLAIAATSAAEKPRRRSLFERPTQAELEEIPVRLTPRDREILQAVLDHRYLTLTHVHALFGTHGEVLRTSSDTNLAKRLRRLFAHGYLARPKAIRSSGILTRELVAALAYRGARALEEEDRRRGGTLRIAEKDWDKERRLGSIEHELLVSTYLVALRTGARRLIADRGLSPDWLTWTRYHERETIKLEVVKSSPKGKEHPLRIQPDGYFHFTADVSGETQTRRHFLEVDRATFTLSAMVNRYRRYYEWWKLRREEHPHFRVITVTETPAHAESLRRAARVVGTKNSPWSALLFTDFTKFRLQEPLRVFDSIYQQPEGDRFVSLL